MKVFRYIYKYKFLFWLLVFLLMLSTALTFVLPYWQSKIVNIGLAQDGIEYAAPEKISQDTYNKIKTLIDDYSLLNETYDNDANNDYYLNNNGKSNLQKLDEYLTNPLAYISYSEENNLQIQNNLYDEFITNSEPGLIKQIAISKCKDEMQNMGINIFNLQVSYILSQGSLMLLFIIIYSIIGYCMTYINSKITLSVAYEKRKALFQSIINFSNKEINKFGEASLLTRTTNDISIIQNFSSMILSTLLSAPITIIVGFVFAYITAPQLSWIVVVAAVAIFLASIISVKLLSPIFQKIQSLIDYINLVTRYILTGVFTTKTWNQIKTETKKFEDVNKPLFDTQLFIGRILCVVNPLLGLGTTAVSILILVLGGIFIDVGSIQVGDLIAFSSYSLIIISSFTSLGMFIGSLPRCNVALKRIEEVINTKPIIKDTHDINKNNFNSKYNNLSEYNIKLNNVGYSYNENLNYEIKNINLEIKSGQTLAIVGETGSGKTTLLHLIMRLNEVSEGEILLNNQNIKDIPTDIYYGLFAYASQESFLFSGTLNENILYGNNDKDNQKITQKIINQVQLESFVNINDIDTEIAQDSFNISGGQRQRISIARALASKRPILVFDDCFTSLDYKIERKIVDSIYKNYPKTTKIVASSRISNIIKADCIICMFQGQIVGQGSFNELLKSCPEFLKIVKSQKQSIDAFIGSEKN